RYRIWGFSAGFYLFNQVQVMMNVVPGGYSGMLLHANLVYFGINAFAAAECISPIFVRAPWWHAFVLISGLASLLLFFGPMPIN
ncbi:MAG: hypothetical protein ACREPT_02315, partial [Rudaea sp.]